MPKFLIKASYKAAIHSSNARLIIEREYPGHNYRLLYLDGEFLDAIQRESPGVIGDGAGNVAQLVEKENRLRLESVETRALSFHASPSIAAASCSCTTGSPAADDAGSPVMPAPPTKSRST